VIFQSRLDSTPTSFELKQAFVVEIRSPQGQLGEMLALKVADGFPHDEVVWTQVLKPAIGGSEFVNGVRSEMEVNGSGYGPPFESGQGYETMPGFDDDFVNQVEEAGRLGWDSVMPACPAMEGVEEVDRVAGLKVLDLDTFAKAPLDVAAMGTSELCELKFFAIF